VLKGFILDLSQSAKINPVSRLFLRASDQDEQRSNSADGCGKPEAEQIHDILAFKTKFG
jgi:hypothetical protein